jgi:translation initiation factor 3 subunit D
MMEILITFSGQLAADNVAKLYATDNILSLLMCSPRSVYPWDIIIVKEGDKLFFDKRDGGPFGALPNTAGSI